VRLFNTVLKRYTFSNYETRRFFGRVYCVAAGPGGGNLPPGPESPAVRRAQFHNKQFKLACPI
jgi:hypothetical protein